MIKQEVSMSEYKSWMVGIDHAHNPGSFTAALVLMVGVGSPLRFELLDQIKPAATPGEAKRQIVMMLERHDMAPEHVDKWYYCPAFGAQDQEARRERYAKRVEVATLAAPRIMHSAKLYRRHRTGVLTRQLIAHGFVTGVDGDPPDALRRVVESEIDVPTHCYVLNNPL